MTMRRTIRQLGRVLPAAALATLAYTGLCCAQQPTYNVGSTPTGIPYTFLDVKTNTLQGAMVDLIAAIGDDAGFKVSMQAIPFSGLIPSLISNKIDIIATAMLITAQRKEQIAFSEPVFPFPEGMVVNLDDNTPYKSLADLKGQVVGAQIGSVYIEFLRRNGDFADIKIDNSLADILRDVSEGRIKAGFGDAPILKYQLSQNTGLKAKLVPTYVPRMTGSVGIGVRKTDVELLKKINASLAKLQANGTLDRILAKWDLR